VTVTMSRGAYITAASPAAGSAEMAAAELAVYCPGHGGYRDECGCPEPAPGAAVTVDPRLVPWPAGD
jgi:hypothetical protein